MAEVDHGQHGSHGHHTSGQQHHGHHGSHGHHHRSRDGSAEHRQHQHHGTHGHHHHRSRDGNNNNNNKGHRVSFEGDGPQQQQQQRHHHRSGGHNNDGYERGQQQQQHGGGAYGGGSHGGRQYRSARAGPQRRSSIARVSQSVRRARASMRQSIRQFKVVTHTYVRHGCAGCFAFPHGCVFTMTIIIACIAGFIAAVYTTASCQFAKVTFTSNTGNFEFFWTDTDTGEETYVYGAGLFSWLEFNPRGTDWSEGICTGYTEKMRKAFADWVFEMARIGAIVAVITSFLNLFIVLGSSCVALSKMFVYGLTVGLAACAIGQGLTLLLFASGLCNNVGTSTKCEMSDSSYVAVGATILWVVCFLLSCRYMRPVMGEWKERVAASMRSEDDDTLPSAYGASPYSDRSTEGAVGASEQKARKISFADEPIVEEEEEDDEEEEEEEKNDEKQGGEAQKVREVGDVEEGGSAAADVGADVAAVAAVTGVAVAAGALGAIPPSREKKEEEEKEETKDSVDDDDDKVAKSEEEVTNDEGATKVREVPDLEEGGSSSATAATTDADVAAVAAVTGVGAVAVGDVTTISPPPEKEEEVDDEETKDYSDVAAVAAVAGVAVGDVTTISPPPEKEDKEEETKDSADNDKVAKAVGEVTNEGTKSAAADAATGEGGEDGIEVREIKTLDTEKTEETNVNIPDLKDVCC